MLIKKGTVVSVHHKRFGDFLGEARRDFDTESEMWFPIMALEGVTGVSTIWPPGEFPPCRKAFTEIKIVNNAE